MPTLRIFHKFVPSAPYLLAVGSRVTAMTKCVLLLQLLKVVVLGKKWGERSEAHNPPL
jgi:hypothetical protein